MKKTTILYLLIASLLGGTAAADDPPTPKSNFMSSLKQSFRQDYEHEVVRGHFDLGEAPNSHRYYCLIDPKSGKAEDNGIAGTLVPRRDGMAAIKDAAVSFYSCADAEAKGLLITSDYHVITSAPVSRAPKAAVAATAPTPASSEDRSPRTNTSDPLQTVQSFIEVYNSGDGAALGSLLGESADFAWVQPDGRTVWGQQAASEALKAARVAGSQLQFQSQEGHTIQLASKNAILVAKLRLTQGDQPPRTVRCGSVLVQTSKGWRIASLFMTPEAS